MLHHAVRRAGAVCAAALALCALSLLSSAAAPAGDEAVLGARYPALSPDGQTVAFEYWGDIWSAPVDGSAPARRLTDNAAWDYLPRYSPDGSMLALVSRRSGNDDIWVMPSQGGAARQVTTHSGSDILDAWLPDSSGVVFHAMRGLWSSDIYTVAVPREGRADLAPETQLTGGDHYPASLAYPLPDGSFVLQRGTDRWWRKRYRGPADNQLWTVAPRGADGSFGKLTQLTHFDGRNDWPQVGRDRHTVYYVCDEDGIDNVWALDIASGQRRQVTHHTTDGVQWLSIAPGSDTLVYEFDGGLWTADGEGGAPRELNVRVAAEGKEDLHKRVSFSDQADELAVSPNGKYVVVVYGGDLWAVRDPSSYDEAAPPDQDLSRAIRLTATDGARERNPVFAPDNRHLAYSSDADGDYNLYVMDLADRSVKQVTHGGGDHLQAAFDPTDSNVLFCYSGNTELRRYNLQAGTDNLVARGDLRDAFNYSGFEVSPDGKWVAYVKSEPDFSNEIYVVDSAGQQAPVDITRDPGYDGDPHWSPDGSRLAFASSRDSDQLNWYAVELNPQQLPLDTDFLLKDDLASKPAAKPATDKDAGNGGDSAADKGRSDAPHGPDSGGRHARGDKPQERKPVVVKIDFKDIHLRARRLTHEEGARGALFSQDGKWLVYQADPDGSGPRLMAVRADPQPQGAKPEGYAAQKVMDGGWSQPQLVDDGRRVFFLEAGGGRGRGRGRRGAAPAGSGVASAKFADGKLIGRDGVPVHGDYTLDQRARWQEMFREGWHELGQRWYDPKMHGVDWDAVYAKYAPYIDHIRTPEEFELVFSELLGELNGSHLGIYMASSSSDGAGPATGHLGLEFFDGTMALPWERVSSDAPAASGRSTTEAASLKSRAPGGPLVVSHITYRGPADQQGVDIQPGDTVLSIDGAPVNTGMRWYDLLQDKAGQPVRLRVSRGGQEHDALLKATSWSDYQGLLYQEWQNANKATVKRLSHDRIGYIHINSMSQEELTKFKREFFSEVWDKDALIVDVRFNPGGNIHEDLFDLLDRQPFGWNVPRDSQWTEQPSHAWLKPKALLINARCGSDAEIFPSGWRTQKFGPIIGTPTAGMVIGTSGFSLVDGTFVRLPLEGWYELNGRNLETQPTPPDIAVDVDPNALHSGDDAQLARAVDVLLNQLPPQPAQPAHPAPFPPAR
jgi:tricorn protease